MNEPRIAVGRHRAAARAPTGPATTVVAATALFHVKFRFKNPLTDAFVDFPAGLKAYLINGSAQVGEPIDLNAEGYAALPFPRATAAQLRRTSSLPNYQFAVRCAVRSYVNLADGTLVRANTLALTDTRDLFELPLEMTTRDRNFTHGTIARFTNGRFANYGGPGEGDAGAPLVFTLNLHWFPLQFRYFNIIKHAMSQVPRGMSVQARLGGKIISESMQDYSFVGHFAALNTARGFQQRLKWLGFYTGPVDGSASDAYTAAIGDFQERHGMARSGTRDAATESLMHEAFERRRVSVMRDNTYLVPVMAKHPVHTEVQFQAGHEDHWAHTANDTAVPTVVKRPRAEVDALAPAERFKYYDLPNVWKSNGGFFRTNNNLTQVARWQGLPATLGCYPAGTTALPTDSPLIVVLDDMVLMRNTSHLETVGAHDRYAIFNLMGEVLEPDAAEPYYSQARNDGANYFPCQDGGAFAAYANGKYYFANRTRVPGNLNRAGLRAAVLNAHPHRSIREPVVLAAGNIQQNYFHGVDYRDSKLISYLIVFWSCKFRRDPSVGAADVAAVNTGITAYKREGLTNCKRRHEEPDHDIVDNADTAPQLAKVIRHFVHWDNSHAKCTVYVHNGNGRDNMGLTDAHFNAGNWQATGGGWQTASGWFTAAHELGHATGLDDDYIEPPGAWGNAAWNSPVIPRFAQWVKGNPFAEDSSSLMNSNEAFRHRQIFHHVDWMNSNADIRALTGDLRFKAKTAGHQYYLPPAQDRNFLTAATRHIHYMPVLSANRHANGTHGHMDLSLYKLGKDQTNQVIIPGQEFDSILVVSLYIKWSFHNTGASTWNTAGKMAFIKAKYGALATFINAKKYLSASNTDSTWFRKIYVLFRLHFHEGGNSDDNSVLLGSGHIAPHFTVTAHRTHAGTAAHVPNYHTAGFAGASFAVDEASAEIPWFRYMLGLDPVTITPAAVVGDPPTVTDITTLSNADLGFLATWANTALAAAAIGSNYTLRDF